MKKNLSNIRLLTKSELQVMKILWSLPKNSGFVNDILKEYKEPRPAYTTLSTFLKILKEKEFVKSINIGNLLYYTATITREEYMIYYMNEIQNSFFDGSLTSLLRFFIERNEMSKEEKNEIKELIGN